MAHSPFFDVLRQRITELGGLFNAHLHLDRAGTWSPPDERVAMGSIGADHSALPLAQKHSLIRRVHESGEYAPERLTVRVRPYVEALIAAGTRRADTLVDCSFETVGRRAFATLATLRDEYSAQLDLRLGAYTPLGFRMGDEQAWACLRTIAADADFIGGLPERDDQADYPDHIGFDESCRRLIMLGLELGLPVHLHVDQQNLATERGAERVLDVLDDLAGGNRAAASTPAGCAPGDRRPGEPPEPRIWLIHMISPSAYDEPRFEQLVGRLREHGVGLICCPSAALSMRQPRDRSAPTHNSIARVLELLAADVPVRLGSDNLHDVFSPASTTDLIDEIFILCNALRFYDLDVLARLGAGQPLSGGERDRILAHLASCP